MWLWDYCIVLSLCIGIVQYILLFSVRQECDDPLSDFKRRGLFEIELQGKI